MNSAGTEGEFWRAAAEDWAKLFGPFNKPIWIGMLDVELEERVFSPQQIKLPVQLDRQFSLS